MGTKLNPNFMAELFKLMFGSRPIMEICKKHLNYTLIPKELSGYKFILRDCFEQFERTSKLPSLGVIAQKFDDNESIQQAVTEIKNAELVDAEIIIDQLENYIKDTEFQILSKRVHDLYESGKKEESIQLNADESKRILSLSLRDAGGKFMHVFKDFKEIYERNRRTVIEEVTGLKVPFGIDALDELSNGGMDTEIGDLALWIMRSGVGKSTVLRWVGMNSCLLGIPTLHIQLEGSALSAYNKYSQIWTHQSYRNIVRGNISEEDWKKINRTLNEMEQWGRELEVYSFEKFGEPSVLDVRNLILEYEKIHGHKPKHVVIDSLDLLKTGMNNKLDNDPAYIKYKLQKCAQLLKNIAVEFKLAISLATQTGDVPMEIWNDPDKVIDRSYTEGDRTLVKPFSFVFTGNRTLLEAKQNLLRIFWDKARDYQAQGLTVKIVTDFDHGRFYDKIETLNLGESTFVGGGKKEKKSKKNEVVEQV